MISTIFTIIFLLFFIFIFYLFWKAYQFFKNPISIFQQSPNLDLPKLDLPNTNLPKLDLPNTNLPNTNLEQVLIDDEEKYQKFLENVAKYSFNNRGEINCGYQNYPTKDKQPIQNLKFNTGYKSTLSTECNPM
jgi:predicted PurR-regulated permease PerM